MFTKRKRKNLVHFAELGFADGIFPSQHISETKWFYTPHRSWLSHFSMVLKISLSLSLFLSLSRSLKISLSLKISGHFFLWENLNPVKYHLLKSGIPDILSPLNVLLT